MHSGEVLAGGAVRRWWLLNPFVDTREAQRRAQIQASAQPAPAAPPQGKFLSSVDSQVSNTKLIPCFTLS